jgi:Ca-activated chloride channel family protein
MTFHSPQYFWLYLPLAVFWIWNFWKRKKNNPTLKVSSLKNFDVQSQGLKARFVWVPSALMLVSQVFLILALARPQISDTKVKKNIDGIDIIIALDISDSMLIEDMRPLNRIEAAKETMRKFVEQRSSDRIGVVIFAGEAFTLVPPTLDYELILKRVSEITTAQQARIKDGTALGVAMANAAGRLKESTAKSRVMIFMTDGENNSGTIDPETGLSIVKGYGIKVYSIGIGRDGPTKIPVYQRDVFGNKIKTYQPFESTVNEDLLGRMAKETGGKYYRASREDSLSGIFNDINALEKTKIDVNKYTRYTEVFEKFLIPAFVFLILSWVLAITVFRRNP